MMSESEERPLWPEGTWPTRLEHAAVGLFCGLLCYLLTLDQALGTTGGTLFFVFLFAPATLFKFALVGLSCGPLCGLVLITKGSVITESILFGAFYSGPAILLSYRADHRLAIFTYGTLLFILNTLIFYCVAGLFEGDYWSILPQMAVASFVIFYVSLAFFQVYLEWGEAVFPYEAFFRHAWMNIFVILIAWLLTGIFWLLLIFWSDLFRLIHIDVFWNVFTSRFFVIVILGSANGLAIALVKDYRRIVGGRP